MSKPPEKRNPPTNVPARVEIDPVVEEITKRISNLIPVQQRAQVVAQVISLVKEERFSGPIPHPKHFEEYERILPGSGRELLDMAKSNLTHSQDLQSRALGADIDDMKEGRRLGFAALVVLMVGAIICGLLNKDTIALALLGATVVGTIGQLIKGRGKNGD